MTPPAPKDNDVFPADGVDHLRFLVGNARQAAHFYSTAFGMRCVAYRGPAQGFGDHAEYVMVSGGAKFVLTGMVHAGAPGAGHLTRHGDSVSDIALEVPDVDAAYRHATSAGARGVTEPHDVKDGNGTVRTAAVATGDDTVHSLIDRSGYDGPFLPGFVAREPIIAVRPKRFFQGVDHAVTGATDFYRRTGLADSCRRPGAQHVALATNDILTTVDAMRGAGVEFLDTPDSYYDDPELRDRIGQVRVPIGELRKRRIRVDRDESGYLLQIFTAPVQDRPTVFFELIERHGSLGFGKGTFKALLEASDL